MLALFLHPVLVPSFCYTFLCPVCCSFLYSLSSTKHQTLLIPFFLSRANWSLCPFIFPTYLSLQAPYVVLFSFIYISLCFLFSLRISLHAPLYHVPVIFPTYLSPCPLSMFLSHLLSLPFCTSSRFFFLHLFHAPRLRNHHADPWDKSWQEGIHHISITLRIKPLTAVPWVFAVDTAWLSHI